MYYLIIKQYKNCSMRCVVGEERQGRWCVGAQLSQRHETLAKGFSLAMGGCL